MTMIARGRPAYFITANVHYAMLTEQHPDLGPINQGAELILADGAPLVWASRFRKVVLPERVAGSDLIYDLCEKAAGLGHSVFLLGAGPGIADEAARRLVERYPALRIAGTACPGPDELGGEPGRALVERIRSARPGLLLVAFGQPKGERWIAENLEALGVPACVQVGATLDFVAGRVRRAPRIYQKIGMEWAYRMAQEPGRLVPRYSRNILFILRSIARDLTGRGGQPEQAAPIPLSLAQETAGPSS
ncbi:WecB/TagA/CpsF family glycosyltransferase (plasmid) [Tundrisphaera sp. TA3]|uniref:WecB/TagA/CpsF family glycosyltransferase n=1 Tax=Tundrisphaera sp. TA3 TaxID=3435775 RepID=UPI003EBCE110